MPALDLAPQLREQQESSQRRDAMNGLRLTLLIVLACGSLGSACRSEGTGSPAATPAAAIEPSGYELVYRKPSGDPFTSAEVEVITAVLRQRMQSVHADWNLSATAEAGNSLHIALPDAASSSEVEALRPSFEIVGQLSFEGIANASTPGWDERAERDRLRAWWQAQAAPELEHYNQLSGAAGGPPQFIRWRALRMTEPAPSQKELLRSFVPCVQSEVLESDRHWVFTSQDLGSVFRSTDSTGFTAIGFELRSERQKDFGDFTEAHVDEQIAVVLDGIVVSAPMVKDRLSGSSIIQGRFQESEVDAWVTALKSDPLPAQLEFVALQPRAAH
jgi:hypothetical protein